MKNPYKDTLSEKLRYFFMSLICKRKGHDIVSEDECYPDHGSMGGYCKRCGYSWHVALY